MRAVVRACSGSESKIFDGMTCGHTWASWHVQAGTPLRVLQELGGWECVEMMQKYRDPKRK